MTIANLNVPTAALRHWLAETGWEAEDWGEFGANSWTIQLPSVILASGSHEGFERRKAFCDQLRHRLFELNWDLADFNLALGGEIFLYFADPFENLLQLRSCPERKGECMLALSLVDRP